MEDVYNQQPPWLPELLEEVQRAFRNSMQEQPDQRAALAAEAAQIEEKRQGWKQSLAKLSLPASLRTQIEAAWAEAEQRHAEIEAQLAEFAGRTRWWETAVTPEGVLDRLGRLSEILARHDPTRGNLELGLHIEQIQCHPSGQVVMRTCKLGTLPEAIEALAETPSATSPAAAPIKLRRRTPLRVTADGEEEVDLEMLVDFVADPQRFAGLGDEWFWVDEFQKPESLSWAAEHAEAVFRRRQEAKLSYAKLGREFGVTPPTARAAVQHYLREHPDATDDVQLPRGGQRPPRINLEAFADEAFDLWLSSEWSKLKLAKRYGCSAPTVEKAMRLAADRRGIEVPTAAQLRADKCRQVREMADQGRSLQEIATALKISDVTARKYRNVSYVAEGQAKPDFRRRQQAVGLTTS